MQKNEKKFKAKTKDMFKTGQNISKLCDDFFVDKSEQVIFEKYETKTSLD